MKEKINRSTEREKKKRNSWGMKNGNRNTKRKKLKGRKRVFTGLEVSKVEKFEKLERTKNANVKNTGIRKTERETWIRRRNI